MVARDGPQVEWPYEDDSPRSPRTPAYRLQAERQAAKEEEGLHLENLPHRFKAGGWCS